MYSKYYLPTLEKGKKGLIYNKQKDKKQPYHITADRDDALAHLRLLAEKEGRAGGYIYTLQRMEVHGNLNGGYKSQPPYQIVGCEEINF